MNMTHNLTLKNRVLLSKLLEKFSPDQLNTVPKGYRNSIFWNVAHTIVTQQLLVYGLSNVPMLVDPDLVKTYRKDTKTVREATRDELTLIKSLLFSTIEQTQTDYDNGVFKNYTTYTTSINETLSTVEEAISFNAFHEGIHLGYILAMKNSL
jgi:hypothetical protein